MKTIMIWIVLFVIAVLGVIGLYIVSTHAMNSQHFSNFNLENQNFSKEVTYEQALGSTDPITILRFCSTLTYKTFQWKYYQLC